MSSDTSRRTRQLPFDLGQAKQTTLKYSRAPFACPEAGERSVLSASLGTVMGSQVTDSENHRWPPRKGRVQDVGGDFYSQRKYVIGSPNYGRISRLSNISSSCGMRIDTSTPIWPVSMLGRAFPGTTVSSQAQLNALGTTAIARTAPTNAIVNLATFLGELAREGLPSVPTSRWKDKTDAARKSGGEYLNLQFGYQPVVNDVMSFAGSLVDSERVIRQYLRDAGRVVRRRWQFPPTTTTEVQPVTSAPYYGFDRADFISGGGGNQAAWRMRTTHQSRWFSGAYTYYLPKGFVSQLNLDSFASRAKNLLRVDLTPEVLWNLAPWSWAVDWFSNVGDILHNVTPFTSGNLVLQWGYVMEHTIVTDTYTRDRPNGWWNSTTQAPPVSGSVSFITETKQRRKATPFGFGASWSGLTPFQASIAAAIGISRW